VFFLLLGPDVVLPGGLLYRHQRLSASIAACSIITILLSAFLTEHNYFSFSALIISFVYSKTFALPITDNCLKRRSISFVCASWSDLSGSGLSLMSVSGGTLKYSAIFLTVVGRGGFVIDLHALGADRERPRVSARAVIDMPLSVQRRFTLL
jgi:hypothetical protein